MIRKFRLPGESSPQHFFCTSHDAHLTVQAEDIIIDHAPSLLARPAGISPIFKLVKPRRKLEYLKMLWHHSRLTKEIKGNRLLKLLGFRVPDIFESGYAAMPFMLPKYIGYYIMEDMRAAGFEEVRTLLETTAATDETRATVIGEIYEGLKTLREHKIVFSDFHFDNVLYNQDGKTAWIDTGVTPYPFYRWGFDRKFDYSVKRLLNTNYSSSLSEKEKDLFRHLQQPQPPAYHEAKQLAYTG